MLVIFGLDRFYTSMFLFYFSQSHSHTSFFGSGCVVGGDQVFLGSIGALVFSMMQVFLVLYGVIFFGRFF